MHMAYAPPRRKTRKRHRIFDLFCGGGGASLGIRTATGRCPDVAVNHDPAAIEIHKLNHPGTTHYCDSVWQVDPEEAAGGHPVRLAWFSPDCTQFSRAKGSKPVQQNIRCLPWTIVRWARKTLPRMLMLENVREFQDWGPCVPLLDKQGSPVRKWVVPKFQQWHGKTKGTRAKYNELKRLGMVGRWQTQVVPDPARKGESFQRWKRAIEKLGYDVRFKVVDAADHGAATHRKRLFMVARRDGRPVVWPEPTHGGPKNPAVISGRLKPWGTAAEHIDWSIPCPSIFLTKKEAKKLKIKRPLAPKTLRRIAMGIKRFVLDAAKPFIVRTDHGGDHFRGQSVEDPLRTVTQSHGYGVVAPALARLGQYGGNGDYCNSVEQPIGSVVSKNEHVVVQAGLAQVGYGERPGQSPRVMDPADPLNTIVGSGKVAAVEATLAHLQRDFGNSVGQAADTPAGTIMPGGGGKLGAVEVLAHQVKHYGGNDQYRARPLEEPLGTITAGGGHHALTTAHVLKHFTGVVGKPVTDPLDTITGIDHHSLTAVSLVRQNHGHEHQADSPAEPLRAITTQGNKFNVAATHLLKIRGESKGSAADAPCPTITAGDGHTAAAPHALGLAAASMIRMNHGDKQWSSVGEPLGTVVSQGNHMYLVYAFLKKYLPEFDVEYHDRLVDAVPVDAGGKPCDRRGAVAAFLYKQYSTGGQWQSVEGPLHTITTKDRYALVTIQFAGHTWVIVDIGMRMLQPHELAGCQGFPKTYQWKGSKSNIVAKIGNSVPPPLAAAIVRANW